MPGEEDNLAPNASSLDRVLLQKVIEIAAASAESVTAAAASDASVRAEIETMRVSQDAATVKLQEVLTELANLKLQRQEEIDHRRDQENQKNKVAEGWMKIWKDILGKALTPSTILILLAIFAGALGVRLTLPTPAGTVVVGDRERPAIDEREDLSGTIVPSLPRRQP